MATKQNPARPVRSPLRERDRNHPLRRRYEQLAREHDQIRRIAEQLARDAAERRGGGQRDPLTGLVSRTELQRQLDRMLRRGVAVAVLLLDLDRFKEVNDTLGHLAGDALLREFARRLVCALDGSAVAARFGGDEFAVLLPGTRDDRAAFNCAAAIRAAFEVPVPVGDARVELESSIGVAIAPDDGGDSARLLHRADVAMYAAKRSRRGIERYDAAHDPRSDAHLAFASALRDAMTAGEIVVHYQPIARPTVPSCASRRWPAGSTANWGSLSPRSSSWAPSRAA